MNLTSITKVFLLSIILTFCCCNYAGTLGSFPNVSFSISQENFANAVNEMINENPTYRTPLKWLDKKNSILNNYNFLNGEVFYFLSKPEELYFVTFVAETPTNNINCTRVAVRAVNKGANWLAYKDLEKSEIIRIQERFNKDIILKLENYTHCKAIKINN